MRHVGWPLGHFLKDVNLRPFDINLDTVGLVLGENLVNVFNLQDQVDELQQSPLMIQTYSTIWSFGPIDSPDGHAF